MYVCMYVCIYIYLYIQSFSHWGNGGKGLPTSLKFAHPPILEKFPHRRLLPFPNFYPPSN